MQKVIVALRISSEEYLKVYRGTGKVVRTQDTQGRYVQFPVNILQPFLTHEGVSGIFEITFSQAGKYHSIMRL